MKKNQPQTPELLDLDLEQIEIQPIDDDALASIAGGCTDCSCGVCSIRTQ